MKFSYSSRQLTCLVLWGNYAVTYRQLSYMLAICWLYVSYMLAITLPYVYCAMHGPLSANSLTFPCHLSACLARVERRLHASKSAVNQLYIGYNLAIDRGIDCPNCHSVRCHTSHYNSRKRGRCNGFKITRTG
jgi:hypothetical protein